MTNAEELKLRRDFREAKEAVIVIKEAEIGIADDADIETIVNIDAASAAVDDLKRGVDLADQILKRIDEKAKAV